jgi:hypothetical protein
MNFSCSCGANYRSPIFYCLRCGQPVVGVRPSSSVLVEFFSVRGPQPWKKLVMLCVEDNAVEVLSAELSDGALHAVVRTPAGEQSRKVPASEVYQCLMRDEQALSLR